MRILNLPRIGRYRLYDLVPPNHVRCRLCRRRFLRDNAWGHWGTEVERVVEDYGDHDWLVKAEAILAEAVRVVLLRRRSHYYRRHGQFEHETGGRYD